MKIESAELDEMASILPVIARMLGPKIMRNIISQTAKKTAMPIITSAGKAAGALAGAAAAKDMVQSKKQPKPESSEEKQRNMEREKENRRREQQHSANTMQYEASAYSDARRAMAADPSTKQRFSRNISASDEDIKSADKNIIMQLRNVVSLKGVGKLTLKPSEEKKMKKGGSDYKKTAGSGYVEFAKGKEKIDLKIAQAILDKYNRLRKPFEKEQFQAKISKSKRDMLKALKEDIQIEKKQDSLREVKKLMKENRER